jgi:hypothetical protein
MADETKTDATIQSVEMTPEEHSMWRRKYILHDSKDPDFVLPDGRTQGEVNAANQERDRLEAEEASRRETEAMRAQAPVTHSTVKVSITEDGQIISEPQPAIVEADLSKGGQVTPEVTAEVSPPAPPIVEMSSSSTNNQTFTVTEPVIAESEKASRRKTSHPADTLPE